MHNFISPKTIQYITMHLIGIAVVAGIFTFTAPIFPELIINNLPIINLVGAIIVGIIVLRFLKIDPNPVELAVYAIIITALTWQKILVYSPVSDFFITTFIFWVAYTFINYILIPIIFRGKL